MPTPPIRRRRTPRRQAVLDLLRGNDHFRSAQELHHEIRDRHTARMGLSTVYRILRILAHDNIAETQRGEDGETLYRLRVGAGHRHYLLCRRCGRAVAFTATEFESRTSQLAREHSYADVIHHLDLFGTCPRCR